MLRRTTSSTVSTARGVPPTSTATLRAGLKTDFEKASQGVLYLSESDYPLEFLFSAKEPAATTALPQPIRRKLSAFFKGQGAPHSSWKSLAVKTLPPTERKAFLKRIQTPSDSSDTGLVRYAQGFRNVLRLAQTELNGLEVYKVGPRNVDGTLKEDGGLYAYLLLGNVKNQPYVSGVMFGSVET